MQRHREGGLWLAHLVHRISGVSLALFLPVHFFVLGKALEGAEALDPFLKWTELPFVKVAEFGLVALLALHLFGGLRVLALEFLPWSSHQKTFAAASVALSFFVAVSFFMSAVGT